MAEPLIIGTRDMTDTRFLFVGDLHYQSNHRSDLACHDALGLWRIAVKDAQHTGASAIVLGGDLIDGYHLPKSECLNDLRTVKSALDASPVPVHAIIGNHESIYIKDADATRNTLGWPALSRSVSVGAIELILFDTTVPGDSQGEFSGVRRAWLSDAIQRAADRPVIIVQHQPWHPDADICEHRHYVRESDAYRRFLADQPNVIAVLTGHRHIPEFHTLSNSTPQANAGSVRRAGDLVQITAGALCSWPVTVFELIIDERKKELRIREQPLGFTRLNDPEMSILPERTRQWTHAEVLRMRPEIWESRDYLITPELADIRLTWTAE